MSIRVKRLSPDAKLPERAHNSAGYDLFAIQDHHIPPGGTAKIPLGIAVEFPPGYAALVWDRSGMGAKGIHRFAVVIDADYRGEWSVILHNSTHDGVTIFRGHKVAQVLFQRVESWQVTEVTELSNTSRGSGGFGSTDR